MYLLSTTFLGLLTLHLYLYTLYFIHIVFFLFTQGERKINLLQLKKIYNLPHPTSLST